LLFIRGLALFFRQSAELNWYRASILGKCAGIKELARAAKEFEAALAQMQADGEASSSELTQMHAVLGLAIAAALG
jgi:hypothetical protein